MHSEHPWGPRGSLRSGLCSLTRWLVFTVCSCASSLSLGPLQPCVQRSVCMAAVFPRTPATVNPAGEGPTVPAVSLGSLGPTRSLGCGLRGGCTMCMLNSLCWPGAAQRRVDVREEAALHLCGVLGWTPPAVWAAMVGGLEVGVWGWGVWRIIMCCICWELWRICTALTQ